MSAKTEVNLTGVKQSKGLWLVKVPKYLSQQWDKAPDKGEVGKITIGRKQGKTEVCFSLREDLAALGSVGEKDASVKVPKDHPFTMHTVGGQTMAVFSQSDADGIGVEGMVVHRAECRPAASDSYMKIKRLTPPSRSACRSSWIKPSPPSSSRWLTTISTWIMTRRRSPRGRWCELSGRSCWTCCFLPLRNTSITASRTWWTSPNSP
ncbi:general transcription factor IIF subunit 2-like isoform 2-T2 [Menidia menidia]